MIWSWRFIRPDSITVWEDPEVRKRLEWYYRVMRDEAPAKFVIAKSIESPEDPEKLDEDGLWDLHKELSKTFDSIYSRIRKGKHEEVEPAMAPTFLHVKVELAKRMLQHCHFCERRCGVNRLKGERGFCRLDYRTYVHSWFHHLGEEAPLVPSGTIFYGSCNFRCVFCIDEDEYLLVKFPENNIITVEKVKDVVRKFKQGEQIELLTLKGWRKVIDFVERTSNEVYEIVTNRGKKIKLTPEHVIIIKNGNKLIEKTVKDLREGEELVTLPHNEVKVIENNNVTYINLIEEIEKRVPSKVKSKIRVKNIAVILKQLKNKYGTRYRDLFDKIGLDFKYFWIYTDSMPFEIFIKLYKNYTAFRDQIAHLKLSMRKGVKHYLPALLSITPEFMRLLGYFVAEGNYLREHGVVFTISNEVIQKDIVNCINKVFGNFKGIKMIYKYKGKVPQIIVSSKLIYILFRYVLGIERGASHKSFPWIIFNVPKILLREFLSAYLTGDGTLDIGKKRSISIRFITTSEKIMYQLSYILGLNHVQYRIREVKPSPKYKLPTGHTSKHKQYWIEVNGYNNVLRLLNIATFIDNDRHSKLMQALSTFKKIKSEIKGDRVKQINIIREQRRVYDIVLEGRSDLEEHVFFAGNGVLIHNCQNHDISQEDPLGGVEVSPHKLALMQKELRKTGARNINHVGGDPTPNIHTILESLIYLDVNVPQLWNSNMYLTEEAMYLLREVIDIWLPDFKYGNNECALRLSSAPRYWEVVSRNHKLIAEWGDDVIIRHLVMPNHLECCTKPILKWIADNMPKALVNIMEQYRPEFLVLRYPDKWPDIARRPTREEMEEAYSYARKLGLVFEPIS